MLPDGGKGRGPFKRIYLRYTLQPSFKKPKLNKIILERKKIYMDNLIQNFKQTHSFSLKKSVIREKRA